MATLGEILRWFVYTVDRLYYRAARRLMRRDRLVSGSERKFRALLEAAPDAMVIVNSHGHIALVNNQTEHLFGYKRDEIIGQSVGELIPERFRGRHREHQKGYMKDAKVRPMGHDLELFGRRKDGSEFPIEISLSPLEADEGMLVISAIRDITERKEAERQLRHLAEHDGLTGLLNRRKFEEHLAREVAVTRRYATDGALLLLDIDSLKDVNDTLGHAHGDELLRRVAKLLEERLRTTDIVARFGGDEFAVLLPHTGVEQAQELAEELLTTIRAGSVVLGNQRLRMTCSAGIASFAVGGSSEEVMLAADVALYDAKDRGRDRLAVHVPNAGDVAERQARASWSRRVRTALDEGLLVPHRQPILNTATREITQYELLVRMRDSDGRMIPPSAFLPTAERTGMVIELDHVMVRAALELIAESNGGPAMSYAVNISARTLADGSLRDTIIREIIASAVDPSRLVFEITETAAIANMDAARNFANPLREIGCAFALDDFGAGFASFYHLKHLPLDWLKIDGDFIRTLPTSPTDRVIVERMAQIGHELGLRTCAEFVEDEETLEIISGYGILHAQGYHIGAPQPVRPQEDVEVVAEASGHVIPS